MTQHATDKIPAETGDYLMWCAESNHEPSKVTITEKNGTLIANDEYIGAIPLSHYHYGLTEISWQKLPT